MAMTKEELLRNALMRVNNLAGTNGSLHKDYRYGWFVIWNGTAHFSNNSYSAGELLAYLHGIEDALKLKEK